MAEEVIIEPQEKSEIRFSLRESMHKMAYKILSHKSKKRELKIMSDV